jgi:histidyl-tRNA synthetase
LGKLWDADIKAETLYVEKAKADKQISHAFENEIPFILWIGENELQTGVLTLKILYKKE